MSELQTGKPLILGVLTLVDAALDSRLLAASLLGVTCPYSCRCFSSVKANPAKIPASDSTFLDFWIAFATGQGRPSQMEHATLWVNVAQLIVAIIALVVSFIALRRK